MINLEKKKILTEEEQMKKFCASKRKNNGYSVKRIHTWPGYWRCTGFLTSELQKEFGVSEQEAFKFVDNHLKNHYKTMIKNEEIKRSYAFCMGEIKPTAREVHKRY